MKFEKGQRVEVEGPRQTALGTVVAVQACDEAIALLDDGAPFGWNFADAGRNREAIETGCTTGKGWHIFAGNARVIAGAPKPGAKDDRGKLRVDLIPPCVLAGFVDYLTDNAPHPARAGGKVDDAVLACIADLARWRDTEERDWLFSALAWSLAVADVGNDSLTGAMIEVARVLEFGAFEAPRPDWTEGYGENNWQGVENGLTRYYAAALRHPLKRLNGEECDADSKLPHMAHCSTNICFLLYLTK